MMKLLGAAGLAAMIAVSPADAAALLFTLSGPTTATFTLDSNPTGMATGKGFFQIANVAGIYNGVAGVMNIDFFLSGSVAQDGGIELDPPGGSMYTFIRGGPQLFSGTLDAPVFSPNTFTLAATPEQRRATLTISAVGGVPEPASWAMMIAGFGVVGFALRRRTVAVRFA